MNGATDVSGLNLRSTLLRTVGFFFFWIVMAGIKPLDLAAGLVAAIVAAIVSIRLRPPSGRRLRPIKLMQLALRFLRQSVIAGIDVAWRALHPRLPLRPGFVAYQPQTSAGPQRDAFCTMTSLLPGTLPTDMEQDGCVLVHCLDTGQPVTEQLTLEENLFIEAVGGAPRDD